ncbi:hypothetical protein [Kineosporia babensis]|uniref:Uncharacterized protein n=1 Tax=Kineosporia babensis TaxID=499548 RepID=A0A9X1N8L6_9ACTN|nr:hypothetical protein [Kineosporia babensis]MCD5309560.1 hypothetical protein [Kineosporia babensis]
MTTTEWITDIVLLLLVLRQLREGRLTPRTFVLPLVIVAVVAHSYLDSIPTGGNDLVLIAALVTVGAVLGIAGGFYTRVRAVGEDVLVKAGAVAAVLWVLGMGSRMVFQLWAEHGGAEAITRFSIEHSITGSQAWVAAFVLMALTEVVTRLGTIYLRSRMLAPAALQMA